MRAVILAAGAGRRLSPMGWDRPKCLLPCPQGTLLDNVLNAVALRGVSEAVIVVGYRRELIERAVVNCPLPVRLVANEAFVATNTLQSLWFAHEYLTESYLLFNGDVWFRPSVLDALSSSAGSALAVEEKTCGEEEVKVMVDGRGRVLRVGKGLNPRECFGESVGMGAFDAAFGRALIRSLDRIRRSPTSDSLYYESAVDSLLDSHQLRAAMIAPGDAIEIDTPEDYERAQRLWSA